MKQLTRNGLGHKKQAQLITLEMEQICGRRRFSVEKQVKAIPMLLFGTVQKCLYSGYQMNTDYLKSVNLALEWMKMAAIFIGKSSKKFQVTPKSNLA